MKRAKAVIGSAWGDEGKGLMTDYFASKAHHPVIVRYCGGANAGHTVVTPNGHRHVFSHFGAGSFAGGRTYLSRFFVVNPLLWRKEAVEMLASSGVRADIVIDPDAPMTIPFDMMINQFMEMSRGKNRHGSVGVGINETMQRHKNERWKTPAALLAYPRVLRNRLREIRQHYVPTRIEELGLEITRQETDILISDAVIDQYMESVGWAAAEARYHLADGGFLSDEHNIIFEGSQGLLLDANNEQFFPHVTHARTGIANIMEIMNQAGVDQIDITYVTRAYSTRHGAGPFPPYQENLKFDDNTNVTNEYQGVMRFGWLDMDLLEGAILHDLLEADINRTEWNLAVTHLDQMDDIRPQFYLNGQLEKTEDWSDVVEMLRRRIGASPKFFTSYGSTRDHVLDKVMRGAMV